MKRPVATSQNEQENDGDHNTLGAAEAGIVRGASRSLGQSLKTLVRSMARLPGIGQLPSSKVKITLPPHRIITMPRRLPVKQVARHADRISRGYDIWGSFDESHIKQRLSGFGRFLVMSSPVSPGLAKNTLLGIAVFETYNAVIERATDSSTGLIHSKLPLAWHFVAGASGGLVHGASATLLDATGSSSAIIPTTGLARMLLHHGLAHSVLFGGYETTKRLLLEVVDGDATEVSRVEFLGCVAISGGFAGQLQHAVSHYSEQVLLVPKRALSWNHPTLRPLFVAFVPSSIAFVALEYGRET